MFHATSFFMCAKYRICDAFMVQVLYLCLTHLNRMIPPKYDHRNLLIVWECNTTQKTFPRNLDPSSHPRKPFHPNCPLSLGNWNLLPLVVGTGRVPLVEPKSASRVQTPLRFWSYSGGEKGMAGKKTFPARTNRTVFDLSLIEMRTFRYWIFCVLPQMLWRT